MFNIDTRTVFIDTREQAKQVVDILVEGAYLDDDAKQEWPLIVAKKIGRYNSHAVVARDPDDNIIEEYEVMQTEIGNINADEIKIQFSCERTKVYFEQHIEWHTSPNEDLLLNDEEISDTVYELYELSKTDANVEAKFMKSNGKLPIQIGNLVISADFRSVFKDAVIHRADNGEEVYRVHDFMDSSITAITKVLEKMTESVESAKEEPIKGVALSAGIEPLINALVSSGANGGIVLVQCSQGPEDEIEETVLNSLASHTKNALITTLIDLGVEGDWSDVSDNMIAKWKEQGVWTGA